MARGASRYSDKAASQSYGSGFNGLAFRSAAADEAHRRFVIMISREDAFHPGGPRFEQEEALFAFFFNACSALECFYSSIYALGTSGSAPWRSFAQRRLGNWRTWGIGTTVEQAFVSAYGADGEFFTAQITAVKESAELASLKQHRNTLTHRGAPRRTHDLGSFGPGATVHIGAARSATIASNPDDVPNAWVSNLVLGPGMTSPAREWLGDTINSLMRGGGDFLARHA